MSDEGLGPVGWLILWTLAVAMIGWVWWLFGRIS